MRTPTMGRASVVGALAFALLAWMAGTADAAITINTVATMPTGCVAPCTVYLDVTTSTGLSGATARLTNGDYVGATWYWDFDSTGVNTGGEPHRHTMGHVVAHLYETPGAYSACVGVYDTLGNIAGPACTSITVGAGSWTTYYASAAGSGTACTIGSPCPVATALTHVGTNARILINRGDSYTFGSTPISINSVTGPAMIGAYGTGAKPILAFSITTPIQINGSTDVKIVDLHTTSTGLTGPFCNGTFITGAYADVSLLRVQQEGDVTNHGTALVETDSSGTDVAFVDGTLNTFSGYAWYGDAPIRAAIIGATVYDEHDADHAFRWQACKETAAHSGVCSGSRHGRHYYVADSTIDCGPDAFDCGTYRGTFIEGVMVGNTMNNVVSTGPQNADPTTFEYPENVAFIANTINARPTANGGGCIHATARHVCVVDNVCSFTNVFLQSDPAGPIDGWPDELYAFNNVGVYPNNGDTASSPHFLNWGNATAATTVQIKNNIFLLTNTALNTFGNGTFIAAGAATVTEDYNLTYAPGQPSGWTHPSGAHDQYADPQFVSTVDGNPNAWRLQSTSPARDAGILVAAFRDAASIIRPQGSAFDIGAYEYVVASGGQGGGRNRPITYGGWFVLLLVMLGVSALAGHMSVRRRRAELADREHVHYIDAREVAALVEHGSDSLAVMLATPCAKCGEPVLLPRRERGKRWPPS